MAKDGSSVHIVVSGPSTRILGNELILEIRRHREYNAARGKVVRVIDLQELAAELQAKKTLGTETIVALLVGSEAISAPGEALNALPISVREFRNSDGVLQASIARPADKKLAFAVVVEAPDAERIASLLTAFRKAAFGRWTEMRMDERRTSYYATLTVPNELRDTLGNWGTTGAHWSRIAARAPGDERPDPANAEMNEAYLWHRGLPAPDLPEDLKTAYERAAAAEGTRVAFRLERPDGRKVGLLVAPSRQTLIGLMQRYPNIEKLPAVPSVELIPDLRAMQPATLIVDGPGVAPEILESVRERAARLLRQDAGLKIAERGRALSRLQEELLVQQLSGAKQVGALRDTVGARYVWLATVRSVSGRTTYSATETRVSAAAAQPGPQPVRPSRSAYRRSRDYESAYRNWESENAQWEMAREAYENGPVTWTVSLNREQQSEAAITLQLFDLAGGVGKVLWESPFTGTANTTGVFRQESRTVRGALARPDSLPSPGTSDEVPRDLMLRAGQDAAEVAVRHLIDHVWLSGTTLVGQAPAETPETVRPVRPTVAAPAPTRVATAPSSAPQRRQVLSRSGNALVINVGTRDGARVGDRIDIVLRWQTVTDPVTRQRVSGPASVISMRIATAGNARSTATLVSARDSRRLVSAPKGTIALWFPRRTQ